MINVWFQVNVFHPVNPQKAPSYVKNIEMPQLPPNLDTTRIRVIPGVGNDLREVSLEWNELRGGYVLEGELRPSSDIEFAKMLDSLERREWKKLKEEDLLYETLL